MTPRWGQAVGSPPPRADLASGSAVHGQGRACGRAEAARSEGWLLGSFPGYMHNDIWIPIVWVPAPTHIHSLVSHTYLHTPIGRWPHPCPSSLPGSHTHILLWCPTLTYTPPCLQPVFTHTSISFLALPSQSSTPRMTANNRIWLLSQGFGGQTFKTTVLAEICRGGSFSNSC